MNENNEIIEIMGRRFARSSCYIAGAIGVILGALGWFISVVILKTVLLVMAVGLVLMFLHSWLSGDSKLYKQFNILSGGAFATMVLLHSMFSPELKDSRIFMIAAIIVISIILVFVLGPVLVWSVFEESRTQNQQKEFENVG